MSIPMALLYYSIWNLIYFVRGKYFYSYGFGFCDVLAAGGTLDTLEILYMINYSTCTGVPPVIVFTSMVAAITKLRTQNIPAVSQKNNQQASLTIIYFSVLFLACNLFAFFNNLLCTVTFVTGMGYPGPIYNNTFMFFYSWSISDILCTVLNATLNPVLYVCCMKDMRIWLLGPCGRRMPSYSRKGTITVVSGVV